MLIMVVTKPAVMEAATKRWKGLAALLAAALLVLCGCQEPPSERPVAVVNGQAVSLAEFRARSAFMGLGSDPTSLTTALRREVVETLVRDRLVLQKAAELGIKLTPEELEREEHGLRRGLDDDTFEQALITQGTDYAAWRRVLARELLVKKTLDLVLSSRVKVSPQEVASYFAAHKKRFSRPEQMLAQHAVLPTRKLAQELLDRVTAGEDMARAAAALGAPMAEGGEPIWLSRGHMPPELEDKIFKLKPGRLAGPLASTYGWHVVRVLQKRLARKATLEQAAGEIQRRLVAQKMEKLAASWVESLRKGAQVSIDQGFVRNGRM